MSDKFALDGFDLEVVENIDKDGFLRLHPVGGWWPHVLLSQAVTVCTRYGDECTGVVGSKAPHGIEI